MDGAVEWLEAAQEQAPRRPRVVFEGARLAAELACKALLVLQEGSYPKSHDISGVLAQKGLLPEGVEGRDLSRLLSAHTLGRYGHDRPVDGRQAEAALRIARVCVADARTRVGK